MEMNSGRQAGDIRSCGKAYNRFDYLISPEGRVVQFRNEKHIHNAIVQWQGNERLIHPHAQRLGWDFAANVFADRRNSDKVRKHGLEVFRKTQEAITKGAPNTRKIIKAKYGDETRDKKVAKQWHEIVPEEWIPVGITERLNGLFAADDFDIEKELSEITKGDFDPASVLELEAEKPKKRGKNAG